MKSKWKQFLRRRLRALRKQPALAFKNMTPAKIPKRADVYLIRAKGKPYYVGRSKNLCRRLYTNHLMGSLANARLKKYLCTSGECADPEDAKRFLQKYASVQWIDEKDMRTRGALEGYFTAVLFPKYGIAEEH